MRFLSDPDWNKKKIENYTKDGTISIFLIIWISSIIFNDKLFLIFFFQLNLFQRYEYFLHVICDLIQVVRLIWRSFSFLVLCVWYYKEVNQKAILYGCLKLIIAWVCGNFFDWLPIWRLRNLVVFTKNNGRERVGNRNIISRKSRRKPQKIPM